MKTVYLSRRNLLTLLAKLDRVRAGEHSACRIDKPQDLDGKYPNDEAFSLQAVEDDEYYSHRQAGAMLKQDGPPVEHRTGVGRNPFADMFGVETDASPPQETH